MLVRTFAVASLTMLLTLSAYAKPKDVEDVTVIDKIPTTMSYNWWIDGKSTVSCSGSSCSSTYRPASAGSENVDGAVLKLMKHDGTIVIVECLPQERSVVDTLTLVSGVNASRTYRSCRMPQSGSSSPVEAEFHTASVKLKFEESSIYGSGRLSTETYLIRGYLHPKPDPVVAGKASFEQEQVSRDVACGPVKAKLDIHTDKNYHPLASTDFEHAMVYIIQQDEFSVIVWGGFPTRYGLDGDWVGADRDDSYFYLPVDPGEHHLCGEWQIDFIHHSRPLSLAKVNLKAGENYYFRARVIFASGNGQRSIQLEPLSADEGRALIAKSAFSEAKIK